MNSQTNRVLIVALASSWFFAIISGEFSFVIAKRIYNHLPAILIPGYAQDSSICDTWVR